MSLQPGYIETLTVDHKREFGYFLSGDEKDILLHATEATRTLQEDEEVSVFLYHDKQGRLAATMTLPAVYVGHYAWARVAGVKKHLGLFVDIGIKKDILLSVDDLPESLNRWPKIDDWLYCSLYINKKGQLFVKLASEDIMTGIAATADATWANQNLTATVYRLNDAGVQFITADFIKGFIHQNEQTLTPRLGEQVSCRVIDVKDDGTINASMQPRIEERLSDDAEAILAYLQRRGGSMPYTDKTHPDDIKKIFHMSKGSFKRALGRLMKENKIYQESGWTHLHHV